MKSHVKRAIETLEALGFDNRAGDYDRKMRKRLYFHPWYPDEAPIRLYEAGSQAACRSAEAMAHKIVELGHAGPKSAETVRERYEAQRDREAREQSERFTAELRRAGQRRARMSKQELEAEAMRQLSRADRLALCREEDNRRYIERLMVPGTRRTG